MFNKKYINVLCKILAWGVYVALGCILLYQIGASWVVSYNPVECISDFVGNMLVYTMYAICAYLFAAVVYKYNNK